jgi:predicted metal-dependent hydrolase
MVDGCHISKLPLEAVPNLSKINAADCFYSDIIIRNPRHCRNSALNQQWIRQNAAGSAWFTALSLSFPRGEAFFIETMRANRDKLPLTLAQQVDAFIAQEAVHAREHGYFNRLAAQAGYDTAGIDARLADFIARTSQANAFVNQLVTACLEHFTAIIAHDVLARPDQLAGADPEAQALWRWHAMEEIEHKGVAYDVWCHMAAPLSPWRRWKIRCKIMAKVSAAFLIFRTQDARELLMQQGLSQREARKALRAYLWGRDGALRRILPAWAQWFRPGFHPWQRDDRALLQAALEQDRQHEAA